MKKLFISIVAVLFAATFSFAQNTDSTSQTGNNNRAITTQTGHNGAYSVQAGNLNKATTTQTGTNTGGIYQLDNGNNNTATLSQNGSGNDALVIQGMTQGYWGGKYQTVGANYNKATLTQSGKNNEGNLEQYGGSNSTNGNVAKLAQSGNGNTAYGYQGWAYGDVTTWALKHLQSYNSTVNISQVGNNNWVGAWQYGGNNNNASITENGNNNLAEIAQGYIYSVPGLVFYTPVYNTQNNNASVTQSGNYNHEKLFQLGNNNSFKLSQANGSSVGYNGTSAHVSPVYNAYFRQDGNNNQFTGVQTNGATLDAVSEGITGYYGSFQQGNGNSISLTQYNDNALMQQLGNSNTATLWQGGTNVNNATILQNGNSNIANVHQQ